MRECSGSLALEDLWPPGGSSHTCLLSSSQARLVDGGRDLDNPIAWPLALKLSTPSCSLRPSAREGPSGCPGLGAPGTAVGGAELLRALIFPCWTVVRCSCSRPRDTDSSVPNRPLWLMRTIDETLLWAGLHSGAAWGHLSQSEDTICFDPSRLPPVLRKHLRSLRGSPGPSHSPP